MTNNDVREKVLKTIMDVARESLNEKDIPSFNAFVEGFFPTSTPDDFLGRGANELFAIAKRVWKFSDKRKKDTPIVKLHNPKTRQDGWTSHHSVLMVVTDDMPFIVDSITGGLTSRLRSRIHMMHHPILSASRDEKGKRIASDGTEPTLESFMYIEIDAQSDPGVIKEFEETLKSILGDVRAAVKDWRGMLAKIDETVASLTVNPPPIAQENVDETIRFLRWLGADHFTFLGFREYRFEVKEKTFKYAQVDGSGLGILRDPDRNVLRNREGLTPMSDEIRHFLDQPEPVIITKANVKSTVHRTSHLDYIGVKIFDEKGKAIGERRFIGLFTSLSYSQFAHDVPLLRQKVNRIKERTSFAGRSHAGKAIAHILETFPRDELFQIAEDTLFETAMGILQLTERPRPRAFLRRDKFERFVSALVYVPRDNYNSSLRTATAEILCKAFNGEVSVYYAMLSEEALARWHFIIRTRPGDVPQVDERDINHQIAEAAQGWEDRLHFELVNRHGEEGGNRLNHVYKERFSIAYRAAFTPAQAAYDILKLEELNGADDLRVDFYHHLGDGDNRYRLKIHHGCRLVPLSSCMPVLENMGFRVLSEHSYEVKAERSSFIHDFSLELDGGCNFSMDRMKPVIEDLFLMVWNGVAEDDVFNRLVLKSAMPWDEIVILRAYGKYLRQLGMGYSPDYIADCMVEHPQISNQLVSLFRVQFDPHYSGSDRGSIADDIVKNLRQLMEAVSSLDQDRIFAAYVNVIQATLRTNFYQEGVKLGADERALAFKIRSREVEEAPLPKPYAEIWVYSPRVEGVHLRGGPVARGGLRWSDRREDFRTEVLGLVKAQQVKNAVIVPQGAKGGFFPKQLHTTTDRDSFMAEGIASYRSFISSLLSVTDNLVGRKVVPPKDVIRRDDDDPYLVVAADKGTATFSDISNGISEGQKFWLDDAFASGGSNGYDHKKMGITAKGAWISVQRHFRELGVNVQSDSFSVVGVGDMGGDVFGNGMLLSKSLHLKAAFNHLHIFIDPDAGDAKAKWKERKRLFDKAGSSWEDYNAKLISKGGGIYSRAAKSIPLSDEVRAWLGTDESSMAPNALIHAILKAEADLLWFGGIGTYVRATTETDSDVGDRANDALRVTARQLRMKVIGEGGNLGMTQKARIEFGRQGGRCNTDFIDNSAGVDCSDKEVNIKILLADIVAKKKLSREDRNALLADMTDEVASIVLSDNYLQTQAISLAEAQANKAREYHWGLIRALERNGDLNREIEYLPSDEGFAEMAANDAGLGRAEISTLMAYAKMSLFDILVRGKLVDNPVLKHELEWSFPTVLRERYGEEIQNHRLRREIVATVLSNEVVNWGGLTFAYEIKEETGLSVEDIIAAFIVVREIYGLQDMWEAINALDYKVDAAVQYDMHQSVSNSLKNQVLWMLGNLPQPFKVKDLIDRFKGQVQSLFAIDQAILSGPAQKTFLRRRDSLKAKGVGHKLATFVAGFEVLNSGPDIIAVSEETRKPIKYVAEVYFALGDALGFDWLRARADRIKPRDRWEVLSIRAEIDQIAEQQRALAKTVCAGAGRSTARKATEAWMEKEKTKLIRASRLLDDLRSSGALSVAKLSFASRHLGSIMR